ncbi:hypothetical protein K504DRAFT_535484 [Pleomassaria siparia CBS 279.74]|uniref:SRR1-like domain-containing protein n=1 Tax=Pleomassaria siparia CBS 279.74 TaxID=1314801 RepID=A0A6G1K5Z3_9PLEO|nr:hypothetical protein K504DRAFT_535484 [Pleomassaria siparia CBS 279.74]
MAYNEEDQTKHIAELGPESCTELHSIERRLMGSFIYNHSLLEEASRQASKARSDATSTDRIPVDSLYLDEDEKEGVEVQWGRIFAMAKGTYRPFSLTKRSKYLAANTVKVPKGRLEPSTEAPAEDVAMLKRWVDQWSSNLTCKALESELGRFRDMAKVENIVCFGLGSLYKGKTRYNEGEKVASWKLGRNRRTHQHIVASHISAFLQNLYGQEDTIPIIAHDPKYTAQDGAILSHLSPPVHIVSDPEHYRAITSNSLILSVHMPSFIGHYDIIADLTSPLGPAAIICDNPRIQERNYAGFAHDIFDVGTPRVLTMFDKFDKETWACLEKGKIQGMTECQREDDVAQSWLASMELYTRTEKGDKTIQADRDHLLRISGKASRAGS